MSVFMRRTVPTLIGLLLLGAVSPAFSADPRTEIALPDIPGYETIICDLHMHTVFSDGNVWPTVRVDEAWRQGLDAIAITDHIEYQPHRDDVPTKHNRPYDIAAGSARAHGVLLTRATEITRDTPPGHYNALFLSDIKPLDNDDFLVQIEEANKQGAFVFWNHHAWKGEERGVWSDTQTLMLEKGWLHGMEVANGGSYYPNAHRWCLEKGLTMLGNSDIHAPGLRKESTHDDHRSLTVAFVKERSLDGLKEALKEGRTAVWHKDLLIGKQEWLEPLCEAMVTVEPAHLRYNTTAYFRVTNNSVMDLTLEKNAGVGPGTITLPAGKTVLVKLTTKDETSPIELDYTVTNLLVAPETGLRVETTVPVE